MEALFALLPVILLLSSAAAGYLSVLVAVHARSTAAADERFSIEIVAASIMLVALCAAFAGGKVW